MKSWTSSTRVTVLGRWSSTSRFAQEPKSFSPKDDAAQPEETEEDRADIAGLKRTKKAQRSIAAMNLKAKPKTPGDRSK